MKMRGASALFTIVLFVGGCSSDDDTVCASGDVKKCPCAGNMVGVQTCNPDGKSWGPCTGCSPSSDGSSVKHDQGPGLDQGPPSCSCPTNGAQRCAGDTVQVCNVGNWSNLNTCNAPQVCADSKCAEKGTGCPTNAKYDGNSRVVELDPPLQVSNCYDGGGAGRTVTYTENQSDERVRSLTVAMPSWTGCTKSPLALGLDFSAIFGVDVSGKVSSSTSSALNLQGTIQPNQHGKFFRQTQKLAKEATLWNGSKFVGTVTLTDWSYVADLATGADCQVTSNLPDAHKNNEPSCLTGLDGCKCP